MFKRKPKHLAYLFIFLLPFFLFFVRPEFFSSFKLKILSFATIPIKVFSYPLYEIKKIIFYHRTFEEYKQQKEIIFSLQARLVGFRELVVENVRLERLLDLKRKLIYSSVLANVVGRDPSSWSFSMVIDHGTKDGIKVGQPVINALGVVGIIVEAQENLSKVMLLTDPQFSVNVIVQRSRESALLNGSLQGVCRLKYLGHDADIRVGDQVITSKLSSIFPEGLLVGEITRVEKKMPGPLNSFFVQPAVALSQLEEVLVILK